MAQSNLINWALAIFLVLKYLELKFQLFFLWFAAEVIGNRI